MPAASYYNTNDIMIMTMIMMMITVIDIILTMIMMKTTLKKLLRVDDRVVVGPA